MSIEVTTMATGRNERTTHGRRFGTMGRPMKRQQEIYSRSNTNKESVLRPMDDGTETDLTLTAKYLTINAGNKKGCYLDRTYS